VSIAKTPSGPPAWRLLLDYVRPHRWSLLAGALLALATGASGLVLPLVARELIGDLSHDRPIGGALLAAAQHLGWPITAEFVERLAVALRREPAKTPDLQLTT